MSLALYRTYRPSRLSEVIGQDHVTDPLTRALNEGRIHHAYLFSGPRGCGKTSTARILARSMLCEQGPTADPCGECVFCTALAPNGPGLVDVIEMDAASHGGVDDTRDLRERAVFVPAQARYKIYIIDEAHMVSKDGFNALLKLIEEPPDHVKFIFATTEVDKVLPTIRSRTFNYAFRLVPARQLQENLARICEAESVNYEPAALALIARASGGGVRDAQSIMGQLIAGAGPEGLTQASVATQLGATDDALLDAVITAIADHDGPQLFAAVQSVVESGHDVRRFVTDLLQCIRDLLVIRHAGDSATAEVLDISEDRREVLGAQAERFGPVELTRFAEVINTGLSQIKGSTSPRLQLEILAARLLLPPADTDDEALLSRIDVLERRLAVLANAPQATAGPAVAAAAGRGGSPQRAEALPAVDEHGAEAPKPQEAAASVSDSPTRGAGAPVAPARGRGAPPPKPRLSSLDGAPPQPPSEPQRTPPPRHPQTPAAGPQRDQPAHPQATPSQPPASAAEASGAQAAPTGPRPAGGAADSGAAGEADGDLLDRVTGIWSQLLQRVQSKSRVAAASWEGSRPARLEGSTLFVEVPSAGQAKSITNGGRDIMLRTILIEDFQIDVHVKAVEADSDELPADEPSASDPDLDSADLAGVELVKQRLGATTIGEIEGS